MRPWSKKILPVLVVALLAQTAAASDTNVSATLSYRKLDDFFQMADGVNRSNLWLDIFVHSTNRTVQATNITLVIHSATQGNVPLLLNEHGRIADVPHSRALVWENPPIISNQPKGSLRLIISYQIPITNWQAFRYSQLADGAAEMHKLMRKEAGWTMALLVPKVDSVVFYFARTNAGLAKVVIASRDGRKEFVADTNAQVKLKLEPSLLPENPEVQLSAKPLVVAPDIPF